LRSGDVELSVSEGSSLKVLTLGSQKIVNVLFDFWTLAFLATPIDSFLDFKLLVVPIDSFLDFKLAYNS
jgi:hypothetical protein